jgi:hypothetical protein
LEEKRRGKKERKKGEVKKRGKKERRRIEEGAGGSGKEWEGTIIAHQLNF